MLILQIKAEVATDTENRILSLLKQHNLKNALAITNLPPDYRVPANLAGLRFMPKDKDAM
jgi:hypothetical protein